MTKKMIASLLTLVFTLSIFVSTVSAADITWTVYTGYYSNETKTSVEVNGVAYTSVGAVDDEWGVAYSRIAKDSSPTLLRVYNAKFNVDITGLLSGTKYYYRTYMRYTDDYGSRKLVFGDEESFTTLADATATPTPTPESKESVVNVPRVSTVSTTEMLLESSFVRNENTVKYAGFVYSEDNTTPVRKSTDSIDVYDLTVPTSTSISKKITILKKNKTYYVRAYITVLNSSGTYTDVYSPVATFTMSTNLTPQVYTEAIDNANLTGADITINVVASGASAVVERGIVYSPTILIPELYSTAKYKTVSGNLGKATITLSDLNPNVIYYVRAFARTAETVYYGDVKNFETKNTANLTTGEIFNVTTDSAMVNGNVTEISSFSLVEKGFVYSQTVKTPTVNDSKVSAASRVSGAYSMTLSNLDVSTTYYVRTYAKTVDTTNYGNVVSFTTKGEKVQLFITLKDIEGKNYGTQAIIASKGDILNSSDLTIPNNCNLSDPNWTFEVKKSENLTIFVTTLLNGESIFMEGIGNYKFAPERQTTRAEVAQILFNLSESTAMESGKFFSDVSTSHSAKAAIDFVSANDIMTGYPEDGTFRPDSPIKRSELSVVLAKFYNLTGTAGSNPLKDIQNHWSYNYVSLAYDAQMINGFEDNTFRPEEKTTRAQVCSIFSRAEKRTLTPLGEQQFTDVPTSHWAYAYINNASIPRP